MSDTQEKGDRHDVGIEKLLADVKQFSEVSDERFYFVNARTRNFIPRTRIVEHSFGRRETYFIKAPNRRSFRKRRTQRPKGARSHIRNYRPEIPVHNTTHAVDLSSDLELILLDDNRKDLTIFLKDGQLYVHKTDGQFKGTYKIGAIENFDVVGFNNTGYGLKNLNRTGEKVEFRINNPVKPQPIFDLMQKESGFTDEQMYTTFNMGMGFFVVCEKESADDILQIAKVSEIVGEVRKSSKTMTVLEKNSKKIVFEGY